MAGYHIATDRAVLRVTGADRVDFLQGVVSNDASKIGSGSALWAAFLTPQGKYLHDFFMIADGGAILLETEAARIADLHKRLRRYTLRSEARVEVADDLSVVIVRDSDISLDIANIAFPDPRHEKGGVHLIGALPELQAALAAAGIAETGRDRWDADRMAAGLPDGSRDFEIERSTLAEGNADFLGGIDWQKGCWMGQEVTARMHYRGLAKRRLVPMTFSGPPPATGAAVTKDGKEVGHVRSVADGIALVLSRVDAITDTRGVFTAGETSFVPVPPDWLLAALGGDSDEAQTA